MPTYTKLPARFKAFQFDPDDSEKGLSAAAAWLADVQIDRDPLYAAYIRAVVPADDRPEWQWVVTQADTAGSPEAPALFRISVGDWIILPVYRDAFVELASDYTFKLNYTVAAELA